jgi:hypothetical protein
MESTNSSNYQLAKCSQCGHQVSLFAAGCPACGTPPPAAVPAKGNWRLNVLGGVAIGTCLLVLGLRAGTGGSGRAVTEPAKGPTVTWEIPNAETPSAKRAYDFDWCVDQANIGASLVAGRDSGLSLDQNKALDSDNQGSDMAIDLGHQPQAYELELESTFEQVDEYALNLMYAHPEMSQKEVEQATLNACHKFCTYGHPGDPFTGCQHGIDEGE